MVESSIRPNILVSPSESERVSEAGKLTIPKEYISIFGSPEDVKTKTETVESSSGAKYSATFESSSRNPNENGKDRQPLTPAFESSSLYPNNLSNDTEEQDWPKGSRSSVKFVQRVEIGRKNKDEDEDKVVRQRSLLRRRRLSLFFPLIQSFRRTV